MLRARQTESLSGVNSLSSGMDNFENYSDSHSFFTVNVSKHNTNMTKIRTTQDVLLFIPNLIGYARILAALTSFVVMVVFPEHWASAILLYIANFAGDLVDGIAARTFYQTSTFGSVLDMVTDRCSTLGLLYVLAGDFGQIDTALRVPAFRLLFLFLMLLDISSHWCQMYSSLAVGLHHKSDKGNADRHILVRWFYKYYW